MFKYFLCFSVITALSLLTASGCNETATSQYATVNLAGVVKVYGTPIESGKICFSPTKSDQAKAARGTISNGQYSVDNIPVGDVIVTFTGGKKTGHVKQIMGGTIEETVNMIPAKYSRGVPVTVGTDGDGKRNFDLK